MTKADLQRIEDARNRVCVAVGDSGWGVLSPALFELLWTLAEIRPDFEELPSWIIDAQESRAFGIHVDWGADVSSKVHALLCSLVNRYGSASDCAAVSRIATRGRKEANSVEVALRSADLALMAARFRHGNRRLPLAIHDDKLIVGRHTCVSFHRTLRVPEDGKKYPLPAGFGRLPILRVEDYAERVPEKWLEQGGFIIPLYQREALFLEFAGVDWRPTIAKVSVGRINAITGQEHDLKLRPHRQDYVVVPEQRWLDGINSGDGLVSQFVAMPLGQGYTIEGQLTDEEEHGGFQITVFEPRDGRFPERDPQEISTASDNLESRRREAAQNEVLKALPSFVRKVIQAVRETDGIDDAALQLDISSDDVRWIVESVRAHFESRLGDDGFEGILKTDRFSGKGLCLFASVPLNRKEVEMGIAAGGTIEQQIFEDLYGVESWDESSFREVTIHIVNGEMYEGITGLKAPETPITAAKYKINGVPWFSNYRENAVSVAPAARFKQVRSVGQIDKTRGIERDGMRPKLKIKDEDIIRIQTPTMKERFLALVERAERSMEAGRHSIAIREASLALDLVRSDDDFSDDKFAPLLVRAQAHRSLGNEADAEADASECLELRPDDIDALGIRAMASLHLGEHLLARNDAERILEANPSSKDALFVIAQAEMELSGELQSRRSRMEIQQVSIPPGKVEAFLKAAMSMIEEGVASPERAASKIVELGNRTGRDLRKYARATWRAFGSGMDEWRDVPDDAQWNAIFAQLEAESEQTAKPRPPLI